MKCQSKIDVSMSNPLGGVDHILIMGKMYECELTPKIYNGCKMSSVPLPGSPLTFQLDKPSYIVTCEDGEMRKYYVEHFKSIVELRDEKLKELGI